MRSVEAKREPPRDPEAAAVSAAVAGDRAALAGLVTRHYDRMHRIAWRITGSVHDAEDVVQDVCCALSRNLAAFRGEALFTSWLMGVVVNACRDQRRRAGTLRRLQARLSTLMERQAGPDGRDLYRGTWLASGLARLPEEIRAAVILVAGESLSHREAAEALGCAESTISWRIHKARKRLRAAGVDGGLDAR
jgi:RNA polymerase sigma factor (sigma-70 family)